MNHRRHLRLPLAALFLLFAASAGAEAIFPVNDNGTGTWAFDQPSAATFNTRIHVAFIGDPDGTGNFRLHYAAVEGSANFASAATLRSDVLLTPAVVIDNGAAYTDARHPQIAVRTETEVIVVFQAVPAGLLPGEYRLFRARITLAGNSVAGQTVSEILDASSVRLAGTLVDPSFRLVVTDGTLRVAYADNTSGNVFFARVGIDNALVSGTPLLLSSIASSTGSSPLPRLEIDSNGFSHVVWAANDDADAEPTGIYYSLVQANANGAPDNVAIGPTQVLSGGNRRWGFPSVLHNSINSIWVVAVDQPFNLPGLSGSVGVAALNPYAVIHDGQPVNVGNVAALSSFFLTVPGGTVLPANCDTYRPDVILDSSRDMHVGGYGFADNASRGVPGRYYAVDLALLAFNSTVFLSLNPATVGTDNIAFGRQTEGDYTRAAFVHFNGKAVHFWSGADNTVAGARNIYVTSTLDSVETGTQSGCAVVALPGNGGGDGIPGAELLILPALLLLLRRASRKPVAGR
ncbi:MAG: hypothetical protein AB1346_06990 [Thermodesulfobacteriota bacterium]